MSSISVGGGLRVWATGRDGSAWYRHGVTSSTPTGTCWYHVPPPNNIVLWQISIGDADLYAVDRTSMYTLSQMTFSEKNLLVVTHVLPQNRSCVR